MSRIFFLFLILSLSIVHGHINYAMFGGQKTIAPISANTALTGQQRVTYTVDRDFDECCVKDKAKVPVKVS